MKVFSIGVAGRFLVQRFQVLNKFFHIQLDEVDWSACVRVLALQPSQLNSTPGNQITSIRCDLIRCSTSPVDLQIPAWLVSLRFCPSACVDAGTLAQRAPSTSMAPWVSLDLRTT